MNGGRADFAMSDCKTPGKRNLRADVSCELSNNGPDGRLGLSLALPSASIALATTHLSLILSIHHHIPRLYL